MSGDRAPAVRQLLGSLTPSQLWGLGIAVVAVISGAFALGVFVENTRGESVLLERSREIAGLEDQVSDHQSALEVARDRLEEAATERAMLESKAEFLNRYVSYANSNDEVSKKLFADYVCTMWRDTQERRLQLDRGQVQISIEDLKGGVSPQVEQLLEQHGIESGTIRRLRDLEVQRTTPGAQPLVDRGTGTSRELSDLEKQVTGELQGIRITKTVTFFDGTRYDVPQPVAVEVHLRPECAPR
jgi:hypothetical protein